MNRYALKSVRIEPDDRTAPIKPSMTHATSHRHLSLAPLIQGESTASWSDNICNCFRSSSVNRMYCVLFPSLSTRMKE
jgi:hypothetical protein